MEVSAEEEINQIEVGKPHVVTLGAGASYAALWQGCHAASLSQRLILREFGCFLDRTDFAAGDVWVDEGRLALRNATHGN
jgi:hypothetical protein